MTYECDSCGACCRHLIVEADELDFARDPRLISLGVKPFRQTPGMSNDYTDDETGEDLGPLVPGYEAGGMLACGNTHPCPAQSGNLCTIYPTRPNVCVAFRAGSLQCQDARLSEGLALLVAREA